MRGRSLIVSRWWSDPTWPGAAVATERPAFSLPMMGAVETGTLPLCRSSGTGRCFRDAQLNLASRARAPMGAGGDLAGFGHDLAPEAGPAARHAHDEPLCIPRGSQVQTDERRATG